MIQGGQKTIELLQWEQAVPERQFVIIDFLRTLSSNNFSSICIVHADMLYALCAIHFGIKNITWYSDQDILDNYFIEEGHRRINKDANKLMPKQSDLIVFSMSHAIQSPFPQRWVQRMLNKTNKRAIVLNSLVAFDKKGQAVKSKETLEEILEHQKDVWINDKFISSHFNGYHELKAKI